MKKFILNKDKKELNPTDEQINRQKDFSRLHHDYEKLTKRGNVKIIAKDSQLPHVTLCKILTYSIN